MASPFQQYQGGIEASTGNLVPAYGQMAAQTANAMAGFGQSIAEGLKQYNENTAKDQILAAEAEQLGVQIQQYAKMFGDSPEHKEFTASLQPYIEQLAKVPSMSLTQKMGTVTSVKAGFANIGQNLQAFEVMRKERLNRDFWDAKNTTPLTNKVTDPVAIAKGQAPWSDRKTFDQNIADFRALAQSAVDNTGAAIDVNKATELYKESIKRSIKTGRDISGKPIAPETLAALQDQIANAESFESDVISGYTSDNDQEALDSLLRLGTSSQTGKQIADEKAAAKAKAEGKTAALEADTIEAWKKKRETAQASIDALKGDTTPNAADNIAAYAKMARDADKNIGRLTRAESDKKELLEIDTLLKRTQDKIDSGEALSLSESAKLRDTLGRYLTNATDWVGKQSALDSARTIEGAITPEVADRHMRDVITSTKGMGSSIANNVSGLITEGLTSSSPMGLLFGVKNPQKRQLSVNEVNNLEEAYARLKTQRDMSLEALNRNNPQELIAALGARKTQLEASLATGKKAPTAADISKQQTKATTKPVDKEILLGVDKNVILGTKQREVQMSVAKQEAAMAGYFQKKYGYVPAGFSETFKANTPEANFKTMETPYGAFMWDGKGWTQIKIDAPKSLNAKETGEIAAFQFSNPDGTPKQFANSGVYLSGNFQGTSTELAKFRTEYRSLAHAERSIERLIEINEMTGESLSPTLKGEAKALLPAIKAALRTEIIGVGTVSNYEQELINDVVAGAADFWSLESSDRAKLAVILRRVQDSIADVPAIYGLTVHRQGSTKDIEGALRQRLLDSGGMSNREAKWRAKNPDKQ